MLSKVLLANGLSLASDKVVEYLKTLRALDCRDKSTVDEVVMRVKTTINAGVCGFKTTVTATSDDMQNVTFEIESNCENIKRLAEGFPQVDGYSEIGAGFDGAIHQAVRETLKGCCSGCIVPCGIFKSMQVAAGLALPAPASIDIIKE